MNKIQIVIFVLIGLTIGCTSNSNREVAEVPDSWESVLTTGNNTTVRLMMWQGDPFINAYIQEYVKPRVKELYGINLELSSGQGNMIVSMLMNEMEAGKDESAIDMMWINGETFYQLKQIDALYGPFTDLMPNAEFVDWNNPFIAMDFQQPIEGYESPWGNVQLTIIYDSLLTPEPPVTIDALEVYLQNHPGTFTIPNEFTGMTLLKSWLIAFADDPSVFEGSFSEEVYNAYAPQLWDYIKRIKPNMWQRGNTFPDGPATMHKLLSNGELHFSMSNNDGEVDNKVLQGLLPETSRAYVFESGTIQNSHYMGIVKGSGNISGAMVVANFLMSPEAQYEKMKPAVWGDGTVLDISKLTPEWQEKFASIPNRKYAPPRTTINQYALMELAPEYMIRIFEDFRTEIIEGK